MNNNQRPQENTLSPELMARAREGMESVLARSAVDMEFRRELLQSPRQALSRHFGRPIPETFNVVFIENQADVTIVLPDPVGGWELDDRALEVVNGGSARLDVLAGVIFGPPQS